MTLRKTGKVETLIRFQVRFKLQVDSDILRKHLVRVSLARRTLPEDLAARNEATFSKKRRLLDDSVYNATVQGMRRQVELLKDLELGDSSDVALWQWHQLLQTRLEEMIALLLKVRR